METKKHKIKTDELYEQINNELDHLGGVLSVVECLAASQYQGSDNAMESLLKNNSNGFMTIMNDTAQRFERTRKLIRELAERAPEEKAA